MNGSLLRDGKNLPTGYGRNQATSTTALLLFSESHQQQQQFFLFLFLSVFYILFYSLLFSWVMVGFLRPARRRFRSFFDAKKEAYFSTSFL